MEYREFLKMKRGKKSQREFAQELGVKQEHYSRVERGQVKGSITWLEEVAAKLDADVSIEFIPKHSQDKQEDQES
ncbi:helix-turn-helix domain-containing protein [Listeria innocua]|jgi:transcriptional regulator with XRE-family HTH domain|uniref:helix-turn-helix domain-containing protein n=1 Tax=Lactobacillales TaxID=186826 RepID=UPI000F2A3C67|nr:MULTISPECIES: helix-turn-helix transcriptional regulator [Enterococcaceae]EAE3519189.1 helix-turn-helix domain-containing protein [Listeria monocytogenes]EKQ5086542.1 helix-turn-helix transcriptional regulator [Listeria innocua]MDN6011561.1 helix-turn-helix transcriptional regulator [Lactococcus lactis]MDN6108593.1 helix-turn-helix transcriptional regulator [Lactococcus sp.]EAE7906464.1 helix-turn-helix domain-containing protein [Listeria monocytogenes]